METEDPLAHVRLILGEGTALMDAKRAWTALKARFGVAFPGDFVRFCDEYGPGQIAEFLRFYHPAHTWSLTDLIVEWEEMFGREETDVPYRIGWGIGHAMPFADTRNGDMAYFLIRTPDPATWRIGVLTRSGEWFEHDMGFTAWLCKVLAASATMPWLPDFWPSPEELAFTPAP